jgi:hypothetical protein
LSKWNPLLKKLNSKKEKERNPHKKRPSSFLTKDNNLGPSVDWCMIAAVKINGFIADKHVILWNSYHLSLFLKLLTILLDNVLHEDKQHFKFGVWRPITSKKLEEMKILDKEDKNSRKCQKERKKVDIHCASIVATMTPIVPRSEDLVPKEYAQQIRLNWSKYTSIVAKMAHKAR